MPSILNPVMEFSEFHLIVNMTSVTLGREFTFCSTARVILGHSCHWVQTHVGEMPNSLTTRLVVERLYVDIDASVEIAYYSNHRFHNLLHRLMEHFRRFLHSYTFST